MKKQKPRFAACTVKPNELISIGGTVCVVTESAPSKYGTGSWIISARRHGEELSDTLSLCTEPNFPIVVLKPKKK